MRNADHIKQSVNQYYQEIKDRKAERERKKRRKKERKHF